MTSETVRRFIRTGRLGCYRLGGCTRVSPEQVAAYLEASLCLPRQVPATIVEPIRQLSVVDELRQQRRFQRALEPQDGKQ